MNDTDYLESRDIALPVAPPAHILKKARRLVAQVEKGTPYWKLRGKRLKRNRKIISIPIGLHWRLVGTDENGSITLNELLSHSKYNTRVRKLGLP